MQSCGCLDLANRTDLQRRLPRRCFLRAVIFVTALIVFAAWFPTETPANAQTPEDGYLRILKLMKNGDYEEVVTESKKIIEQWPQFVPSYGKLVEASDTLGQLDQAESYFTQLLKAVPADPQAYYGLAIIQRRLKNPSGAIEIARQCQNVLPDFAPCYVIIADAYLNNLKRPEEAESYLKSVIAGNPNLSAAHYGLGYLYYLSGKWGDALAALEKSISLNSSLTDAKQVKALVFYYNSRYAEALDIHRSLLKLAEEGRDIDRQLRARVSIGILYRLLGNYPQAVSELEEGLRIAEEIGDLGMVNTCLSNLGAICLQKDDYSRALRYVQLGLAVVKKQKDRRNEGRYLGNLGEIYHALGNLAQAISFSEQGLGIAKELNDQNNEASIHTDLGRFYTELKRYDEAQIHFEEAIRITQGNSNRTLERDARSGQSVLQFLRGDYQDALDSQQRALQLAQEISSPARIGDSQNSMGTLLLRLSKPEAALQSFKKALEIGEKIAAPRITWQAYAGMAAYYDLAGRSDEARSCYEKAVGLIEGVRAQLGSEEEKIGFFQNKTEVYRKLLAIFFKTIGTGMERESAARAFGVSERARARAFLDLLAEGKINLEQQLATDLLEQRQQIDAAISRINSELMKERAAEPVKQNKAAIERLEKERGQADKDYDNWLRELRRRDPSYARLKYPEPVSLSQTQQLLDEQTVMLSYSLGETASYLFAVSRNEFWPIPLKGTAQEIGREVEQLVAAITDRKTNNFRKLSVGLYERLIQPASKLLNGKSELIIVADGALHRLPFEVLLTPSAREMTQIDWRKLPYLVSKYAISYAPSASVLSELQDYHREAVAGQKAFVAFADPLYEPKAQAADSVIAMAARSARGDEGQWLFKRLAHSRNEAEGIARLFPTGEADVFEGAQATEENAKAPGRLGQYRIVHFAAHGLINQSRPRFSGIVLSLPNHAAATTNAEPNAEPKAETKPAAEDGILQAYEIFNLKLNADLVVLSACETGLGKEVNGEGLMGLTRAFIYAGTPSVVVSLWNVDDEMSSKLMIQFYSHLKEGLSKSKALRQAQLDLIAQARAPFFWAPFVLIGRAN